MNGRRPASASASAVTRTRVRRNRLSPGGEPPGSNKTPGAHRSLGTAPAATGDLPAPGSTSAAAIKQPEMKGCDGHTLTKPKSKLPRNQTGSKQLTAGQDRGRDSRHGCDTVHHQQGDLTASSEEGPRPGRKPMTRNRPGPEKDLNELSYMCAICSRSEGETETR